MDLLERYYYFPRMDDSDTDDVNAAKRKALQLVLLKLMEEELTPRQRICFRYKYLDNLTQQEIAHLLGISQPTVCRHLGAAKRIMNDNLRYCYLALSKGLHELEKNYL